MQKSVLEENNKDLHTKINRDCSLAKTICSNLNNLGMNLF